MSGLNAGMGSARGDQLDAGFAKLQGEDFQYIMQSYEIIVGRNSKKGNVDIDLSTVGEDRDVSLRHARIFYDFQHRSFALELTGKFTAIWPYGNAQKYLAPEDGSSTRTAERPWHRLLELLKNHPERFIMSSISRGTITLEFVSLVSLADKFCSPEVDQVTARWQKLPNDPSRRETAPKGIAVIVADKVGTRLSLEASQPGRLRRCQRLIPATQDHSIPMPVTVSVPARSSKKLRRHDRSPRASTQKGVGATLAATSTQPPTTGHTSPPPPDHAPPAASSADPPAVATENSHPSKLLPQERPDLDAMKPHRPSRAAHLLHLAIRATTPHLPRISAPPSSRHGHREHRQSE
nr:uncharacterized protein LOC120964851 [Aegilops tauschii subsp. strangulata]